MQHVAWSSCIPSFHFSPTRVVRQFIKLADCVYSEWVLFIRCNIAFGEIDRKWIFFTSLQLYFCFKMVYFFTWIRSKILWAIVKFVYCVSLKDKKSNEHMYMGDKHECSFLRELFLGENNMIVVVAVSLNDACLIWGVFFWGGGGYLYKHF